MSSEEPKMPDEPQGNPQNEDSLEEERFWDEDDPELDELVEIACEEVQRERDFQGKSFDEIERELEVIVRDTIVKFVKGINLAMSIPFHIIRYLVDTVKHELGLNFYEDKEED